MSDAPRLLAEAIEQAPMSELARFNAERAKLLRGKPIMPGERIPLAHTHVGGDLPENEG